MATKHIPVNSKQYDYPIGPEQPRTAHHDPEQYDRPIGPKRRNVNPNQYPSPAGPKQVNANQYPHGTGPHPVNPNQYPNPSGPAQVNPNQYPAGAGPQISNTRRTARRVGSVLQDLYDAGNEARSIGREIGQSPAVRAIASQSGFGGGGGGFGGARSQPAPRQDYGVARRAGSIVITTCDEYGNCKTKRINGGQPQAQPRRRPGWGVGGLGGFDPGF